MTTQLTAVLSQIQTDFKRWTRDDRERACRRILIPLQKPAWTPGSDLRKLGHSMADIDGWDILPLYQGSSAWLRDPAVIALGCAIPSSSGPGADAFDKAHEDDMTCSNSVQVAGDCWLNGTANYAAFGIMVRLYKDEFSLQFRLAQEMAEGLIRLYKAVGLTPKTPSHT